MFEEKTLKEVSEMTIEEQTAYKLAKDNHDAESRKKEIDEAIAKAKEDDVTKEDLDKLVEKQTAIVAEIEKIMLEQKAAKSNPSKVNEGLRKYIMDNYEVLKAIKANPQNAKQFDITIKGTQGATDIGQRDDYAEFLPGTERLPVRRTNIIDLFKRKKVSREYIKYREEDVVTRDAKFVIACATSTHTTKKTWVNRTVELAKIRDIVDVCLDMVDDYDFVESEVKELINESIKLTAEYELLLGASAAATDMLSIDSISSEFDPTNVLAPFNDSFELANLEQLVDAMAAQITIFGQQNKWMPDTVVMNFADFVRYRNLKDTNGNKLIRTLSDTVATIAGLRVITNPIVVTNTLFVFDSTQGEILDRQKLTVKTSYENNDNIEHEMVTFVAVERLQFHVKTINRDAFMKCSNVTTAIADITDLGS